MRGVHTASGNELWSHGRRSALWLKWFRGRRDGGEASIEVTPPSDGAVQRDETCRRVRDAVYRLAPVDREVIVLFHLEELSVTEISQMLGATRGAIDVRLYRARRRLAAILGDESMSTNF